MTNLTDFRKTAETGVDPRLILVSLWCGGTGGQGERADVRTRDHQNFSGA